MPEELQFLNDTKYVKHRCPATDPACVEGWTGGDFEDWAPEESIFNANGGLVRTKYSRLVLKNRNCELQFLNINLFTLKQLQWIPLALVWSTNVRSLRI